MRFRKQQKRILNCKLSVYTIKERSKVLSAVNEMVDTETKTNTSTTNTHTQNKPEPEMIKADSIWSKIKKATLAKALTTLSS